MDLALLLWMLTVWKGLMLRDCLLSAIPLTWTLSRGDATDTGCGAALAVVPMLHKQLRMTWQRAQRQEANTLAHADAGNVSGGGRLEGVCDCPAKVSQFRIQLKRICIYPRQLCKQDLCIGICGWVGRQAKHHLKNGIIPYLETNELPGINEWWEVLFYILSVLCCAVTNELTRVRWHRIWLIS